MPARFRPCTPADQYDVVPLIYRSGPHTFDFVFSIDYAGQAQDFLHYAYQCDQGQFSHSAHTAITSDNKVVGSGCLSLHDTMAHNMWYNLKQIVAFYGVVKSLKVLRRGLKVERIIPPPSAEVAYISNLAVAKSGCGWGSQLIEHFTHQAHSAGVNILALDVADSNHHARRLYERLGFVPHKNRPALEQASWGWLEGHTYMEKSH